MNYMGEGDDRVDQEIVKEMIPHYVEGWYQARSKANGGKPADWRSVSVDDRLTAKGIHFGLDRELWLAYERAIKKAAVETHSLYQNASERYNRSNRKGGRA